MATVVLMVLLTASTSFSGVRRIVLFIADGWGYNQVQAADYWNGSSAIYEDFPVKLAMSTFSWSALREVSEGYSPDSAWTDFNYVKRRATDSAAAATAMSTGLKTCDAALNVDPTKNRLETLVEVAEKQGWATGVITSVEFSHATPAGFVAHNPDRGKYRQIALEMIDSSACEVIMGAGHPFFDDNGAPVKADDKAFEYIGGKECWQRLESGLAGGDRDGDGAPDPWMLVQTRAGFQRLVQGKAPDRVLGVAPVHHTLSFHRDGLASANEPRPPYSEPLNQDAPTLREMTLAALNALSRDPDGFFLMVEGGAVDWANHNNVLGRMIEEMNDFNASVEAVSDWLEVNGGWAETLVIVTGDHECGYLWGPDSGPGPPPRFNPIADNGPGEMPGFRYYHDSHTNSLIPLFAKGAGSERLSSVVVGKDPVRDAYIDNTGLAKVMFELVRER